MLPRRRHRPRARTASRPWSTCPSRLPECLVVGRRRHAVVRRARPDVRRELPDAGLARRRLRRQPRPAATPTTTSHRFVISAVLACSRWWLDEVGGFDESFSDLRRRGLGAGAPVVAARRAAGAPRPTRSPGTTGPTPGPRGDAGDAGRDHRGRRPRRRPGTGWRGLLRGPADLVVSLRARDGAGRAAGHPRQPLGGRADGAGGAVGRAPAARGRRPAARRRRSPTTYGCGSTCDHGASATGPRPCVRSRDGRSPSATSASAPSPTCDCRAEPSGGAVPTSPRPIPRRPVAHAVGAAAHARGVAGRVGEVTGSGAATLVVIGNCQAESLRLLLDAGDVRPAAAPGPRARRRGHRAAAPAAGANRPAGDASRSPTTTAACPSGPRSWSPTCHPAPAPCWCPPSATPACTPTTCWCTRPGWRSPTRRSCPTTTYAPCWPRGTLRPAPVDDPGRPGRARGRRVRGRARTARAAPRHRPGQRPARAARSPTPMRTINHPGNVVLEPVAARLREALGLDPRPPGVRRPLLTVDPRPAAAARSSRRTACDVPADARLDASRVARSRPSDGHAGPPAPGTPPAPRCSRQPWSGPRRSWRCSEGPERTAPSRLVTDRTDFWAAR